MIKKIIWTIILLSPGVLTLVLGFLPIGELNNGDWTESFNYSGAVLGWTKFVEDVIEVIKSNGRIPVSEIILPLFVAIFWTMPFWYAWKGTFFLIFLPFRIILLILLFFLPQIMEWISLLTVNDIWAAHAIFYTNIALLIIALVGLWLKS